MPGYTIYREHNMPRAGAYAHCATHPPHRPFPEHMNVADQCHWWMKEATDGETIYIATCPTCSPRVGHGLIHEGWKLAAEPGTINYVHRSRTT